jgi:exopolysaccharide biosynthesis operon protein EpsL
MTRLRPLIAATLATLLTPAHAFWNDRIEVFADETMTWDTNVFRLSKNLNNEAALGTSDLGDHFNVHSLGATLDIPYSLQRFQAGYTWFATRYHTFKQLDFNGHTANANWLWAITPHLTGDLGYADSVSLANFAVFRGTRRDLVTARQGYANGTWAITPTYQLFAGVTRTEREHDDPLRKINDLRANAAEVRASYVNAADNRIGLSYRREEGQQPDQVVLDLPFNNKYRQDSVGVVGRWVLTGHSTVDGRADYVKRDYEQFSERDYKGPSFRGTWTWTPTGKTSIVTTAYREIAPLDDIQTAFVLTRGITFRPRWDVSAKVAVLGTFDFSKWDYRNGLGVLTPSAPSGDYTHHMRTGGVSVVWRPYRRVMFQAGILREVRTSTLANADYQVNVFSLEGRIGF